MATCTVVYLFVLFAAEEHKNGILGQFVYKISKKRREQANGKSWVSLLFYELLIYRCEHVAG